MKSIRQRLQSRISLRRNCIRDYEDMLSLWKAEPKTNLARRGAIVNYRQVLKELAGDQKLDRELYAMVIAEERQFRLDEMVMNTYTHSPSFLYEGHPVLDEILIIRGEE